MSPFGLQQQSNTILACAFSSLVSGIYPARLAAVQPSRTGSALTSPVLRLAEHPPAPISRAGQDPLVVRTESDTGDSETVSRQGFARVIPCRGVRESHDGVFCRGSPTSRSEDPTVVRGRNRRDLQGHTVSMHPKLSPGGRSPRSHARRSFRLRARVSMKRVPPQWEGMSRRGKSSRGRGSERAHRASPVGPELRYLSSSFLSTNDPTHLCPEPGSRAPEAGPSLPLADLPGLHEHPNTMPNFRTTYSIDLVCSRACHAEGIERLDETRRGVKDPGDLLVRAAGEAQPGKPSRVRHVVPVYLRSGDFRPHRLPGLPPAGSCDRGRTGRGMYPRRLVGPVKCHV